MSANSSSAGTHQRQGAWSRIASCLGVERVHLITGGLGNQMFQHAYAMALQSTDGVRAAVDGSRCGNKKPYVGYEIDRVFVLDGALPKLGWASSQLLYRTARACGAIVTDHGDVRFAPRFMRPGIGGYIQGFFPSYRYFSHDEGRVRQAFRFREPLPAGLAHLATELGDVDSVAVHVRRGDYLHGDHAKAFAGICTPAYYRSAIRFLLAERPSAQFYFFSDDPQWCREEFADVAAQVIDGNPGATAWIDLALMARCRHAIIANSSFSWWGRWLGGYGDAVCVGPSKLMNATDTLTTIEDFLQPRFTLINEHGTIVRPAVA